MLAVGKPTKADNGPPVEVRQSLQWQKLAKFESAKIVKRVRPHMQPPSCLGEFSKSDMAESIILTMFDLKFNHIALTVPCGAEDEARRFYCDLLGLMEIEKPDSLKSNGGLWLQTGNLPLHIGVEDGVDRRRTKRHPAFEVNDLLKLKEYLSANGVEIKEATAIPGFDRFYVYDPFGNRLEFIQPADSQAVKFD